MSLSLLITGGNHQRRLQQVKPEPNPDLLVIDPEKRVGIGAVRFLEKFLQRKPYQEPVKTVVIARADKLTLPAQQALLKTLEEPPAHSQIILLCSNENQLLPTIVSRCLVSRLPIVNLTKEELIAQEKIYSQLSRAGTAQRFSLIAAEATNSETAQQFVTGQLHYLHHRLRTHPETVNVKLIKALNRALSALKFNVNPKLTLEILSLNY